MGTNDDVCLDCGIGGVGLCGCFCFAEVEILS